MNTPHSVTVQRSRAAIVIWALVRLPALAILVYLLRQQIVDAIERQFDIFYVTVLVVDVVSTPLARLISAAGLFAVLLLLVVCVRRLHPLVGYWILLVTAAAVIAVSLNLAATSIRRALFVELILAMNLAPSQFVDRLKQFPRVWNTLMLAGVGLVELFLWREYWQLGSSPGAAGTGVGRAVPAGESQQRFQGFCSLALCSPLSSAHKSCSHSSR